MRKLLCFVLLILAGHSILKAEKNMLTPMDSSATVNLNFNDSLSKRRILVHVYYDNDNYLFGLKDLFKIKDGNDYGYTFSLGTDITYAKNKNSFSFIYSKGLYSMPVRNSKKDQLAAKNPITNKGYYILRQIDVDRLALKYKRGVKYSFNILSGLEFRSRYSDRTISATNIQALWHSDVLNIHNYYYVGPEAGIKKTGELNVPAYDKEILPDPVGEISVISDISIGYSDNFIQNKIAANANAGFFLSTEPTVFAGQNTFAYLHTEASAFLGKKFKVVPSLKQDFRFYSACNASSKRASYIQSIGLGCATHLFGKKILPSMILTKTFGRTDYQYFNDNDIIFRFDFILEI